jgi:hypothetical protein
MFRGVGSRNRRGRGCITDSNGYACTDSNGYACTDSNGYACTDSNTKASGPDVSSDGDRYTSTYAYSYT